MATLLNLLAWVIFSKGIWPREVPGMGKDFFLVAPNGLGSLGRLLEIVRSLCCVKGQVGPWGG